MVDGKQFLTIDNLTNCRFVGRVCVYVCVCVRACVRARACVCVCV